MPRSFFRRFTPSPQWIESSRALRPFAALLRDPALWTLSRRNTARGLGIGVFCAFLPIPFQTALAMLATLYLRVNLPATVLAVFVSNPVTIGPMLWAAYLLGAWILGIPTKDPDFEFTLAWAWEEMARVWQPLLLGSLLLGAVSGFLTTVIVDITWRALVMRRYRQRPRKRPRLRLPRLPHRGERRKGR